PNPDFTRPAGDGIGHRAVETHAGDREREQSEDGAQIGKRDFLVNAIRNFRFLASYVGNGHASVRPMNDFPDGLDIGERIRLGTQHIDHLIWLRVALIVGNVHNRRDLLLEAAIAGIPRYSDDFHLTRRAFVLPQNQTATQGTPAGKIDFGKSLVDDRDRLRGRAVAFFDVAASQARDLHRGQELRSDGQETIGLIW